MTDSVGMNQRDRDLARIAKLLRLARAAQGRSEDPTAEPPAPSMKWRWDAGEILRVAVGPGQQVITVDVLEVGGWGFRVVDVVEVERLETNAHA